MKNVCSVTFCGRVGIPQRCGHATCADCRLRMTKVSIENGQGFFKYSCALCREEFQMNPRSVSIALSKQRCSWEMPGWCDNMTSYMVTLLPCTAKGCACKDGVLQVEMKTD